VCTRETRTCYASRGLCLEMRHSVVCVSCISNSIEALDVHVQWFASKLLRLCMITLCVRIQQQCERDKRPESRARHEVYVQAYRTALTWTGTDGSLAQALFYSREGVRWKLGLALPREMRRCGNVARGGKHKGLLLRTIYIFTSIHFIV